MFKRIFLITAVNIAIFVSIGLILTLFGVNKYLTSNGISFLLLFGYSLIVGFSGALISLFFSKIIAKWTMNLYIVNPKNTDLNPGVIWVYQTIAKLSQKAGIAMPEVAVYDGEPNAFATGWSKNHSLIAVSTGLLNLMDSDEVESVLAHEISHIQNGDMVTLTLIQGVVNTFTIFLSRIIAYGINKALGKYESNLVYFILSFIFDIVFSILGSIIVNYYSRVREYKADYGSVMLNENKEGMIKALLKLQTYQVGELSKGYATAGVANKSQRFSLFNTHPTIEDRITAISEINLE